MIYLIYGQPGSGKTTLGQRLCRFYETPFFIDGDDFRSLYKNLNYKKSGREINIQNSIAVATFLNKKSPAWGGRFENCPIVISMVSPYKRLRDDLVSNNPDQTALVLLKSNRDLRREFHVNDFEEGQPDLTLTTDKPEDESFEELTAFALKRFPRPT